MHHDPRLTRLDEYHLRVENRHGVEATLFANTANCAFANRMLLAVMAIEGLQRVFGDVDTSLL